MSAVADWVNVELTAILDECGTPRCLGADAQRRLERLNRELTDAIKENRYPMSTLFEIRKIYQGKENENE